MNVESSGRAGYPWICAVAALAVVALVLMSAPLAAIAQGGVTCTLLYFDFDVWYDDHGRRCLQFYEIWECCGQGEEDCYLEIDTYVQCGPIPV